jgi:hypothetical protein
MFRQARIGITGRRDTQNSALRTSSKAVRSILGPAFYIPAGSCAQLTQLLLSRAAKIGSGLQTHKRANHAGPLHSQ